MIRLLYGIKSKAAISLPFNCKCNSCLVLQSVLVSLLRHFRSCILITFPIRCFSTQDQPAEGKIKTWHQRDCTRILAVTAASRLVTATHPWEEVSVVLMSWRIIVEGATTARLVRITAAIARPRRPLTRSASFPVADPAATAPCFRPEGPPGPYRTLGP